MFLLLMRTLFKLQCKWAITLQVNASYYISNIDGVEALVELESQSDNKNELTNLDFERQTEKAYPWYKTVAELAEW